MHGEQETSQIPRATCTALHAVMVAFAAWIYFGGGAVFLSSLVGRPCPDAGDFGRRVVLMCFAIAVFVRLTVTFFILLKRRFAWSEFWGVITAIFVYQVVFAVLALCEAHPVGATDLTAIALFLVGSYLNTGSELQRKRFKQDPRNRGKLYTDGLFRYARHINYFGDFLWVAGWALVTRNIWALAIPILLAMGFIFGFIPSLTKHLRGKYGDEFDAWEKRTKAFIPFVY